LYFFFGVSEVADCMFLLFNFFKRQTWAQTFNYFNHSESIGSVRKCTCL